ncbi:MAG: hypothetical protein C5B50_21615 [Verrucomicrobia bacterium]|nr:MAG: hypothetical protein C5B50_21615 [Verrucomicrobiota bacterium]
MNTWLQPGEVASETRINCFFNSVCSPATTDPLPQKKIFFAIFAFFRGYINNASSQVNKPLNRDEGIETIRAIVADCLARDLTDVRPESRLITELGADSLDFIDLIFTLEKRFGVRIRETDLNPMMSPDTAGSQTSSSTEFLPPDALSRLLPWLPELAATPDLSRVRPSEVWPLITVEALWRLVELKTRSDVGGQPQRRGLTTDEYG